MASIRSFSTTAVASRRAARLRALRELGLDLAALLWPANCVGCGLIDRELCAECTGAVLGGPAAPVRLVDGVGVPCYAATAYEGPVKRALLAYKHGGAFGFVRPLGRRLSRPLERAIAVEGTGHSASWQPGGEAPMLVPIPSRPQRVRERGWKHVDELVKVALRVSGLPAERCSALRALRHRTGQVGLDAVRRERNARLIAVRARAVRRLQGRPVILIDDIVTTGATLRAAVAVLEAAGIEVIAAVALCAALRRDVPQKTEWNLTGERG